MKLKRLGMLAVAAAAGGVGLVLAVDCLFKTAVSNSAPIGGNLVIAESGFLAGRRAVHLACAGTTARIVTKVRFQERSFISEGARADGQIHIVEWHNRGRAKVVVKVPMTVVSKDWIDTLESDALLPEAFDSVITALREPTHDFIAVHALEHGFYFHRPASSARLPAVAPCLPN